MGFTVADICAVMEAWAPPELAYDWDRVGLMCGSRDTEVTRVLTCLSVNPEVYRQAVKKKANLVVSHHPLVWDALKRLDASDPHTRMCLDFVQSDIACFNAHTNLDLAPGGVNTVLADALGLEACRPLFPAAHLATVKIVVYVPEAHLAPLRSAMSRAGAGVIGAYSHCSFSSPGRGTFMPGDNTSPFIGQRGVLSDEPELRLEMVAPSHLVGSIVAAMVAAHPYEEPAYDLIALKNASHQLGLGVLGDLKAPVTLDHFAKTVIEALDLGHARVVGEGKRKIGRIAVMGGAGGSQVRELPAGVDAYVTGDVKYHDAEEAAKRGIALIDAGHWGTEKAIAGVMAAHLKRQCPGLHVSSYIEPDYFRIITGQESK